MSDFPFELTIELPIGVGQATRVDSFRSALGWLRLFEDLPVEKVTFARKEATDADATD